MLLFFFLTHHLGHNFRWESVKHGYGLIIELFSFAFVGKLTQRNEQRSSHISALKIRDLVTMVKLNLSLFSLVYSGPHQICISQ